MGAMDLDLGAGGFCGVVLAGGTAARMDGIDKAAVELHGRTLLELAVDAFLDADEVVVVAPASVPTARPVTFVCEDPPRGGPVAGLLTGVDALLRRPRLVGVLAVDMPRVTPATMRRLRDGGGRPGRCVPGRRRRSAPARRCRSTRPAWPAYVPGWRRSTAWRCTGCSRRSTSPTCRRWATRRSTSTRGPTCATCADRP